MINSVNNGRVSMSEQSESVKKWLERSNRITPLHERNFFEQKTDLEKVVQRFTDILDEIRADFRAKQEAETSVKLTYLDEDLNKMRTTRIKRSDPTEHEILSEKHLSSVSKKLDRAKTMANYPLRLLNSFAESMNSENVLVTMYPKVERAAITELSNHMRNGLFQTITKSLISDETFKFREGYAGLIALKEFDKQIDLITSQVGQKPR